MLINACDLTEKPEKTSSLDEEGLYSANLSPHYALIGNLKGHAELWQLNPQALLHKWQHTDEREGVIAAAIAANEQYAVTAEKNSLAWWRIKDGMLLAVWSLPQIFSLSLSSDGSHALVGLSGKAILLSLQHGTARFAFKHDDIVSTTDISSNGHYAITGSADHTAKLWRLSDGSLVQNWQHDNKLATVALSANGSYALTNAVLSQARLWKITTGKVLHIIGPKQITLASARFSTNEKLLLTGHISQRIELWNVATGKIENAWRAQKNQQWPPSAAKILDLSFDVNNKKFHSIATNGILQRWYLQ